METIIIGSIVLTGIYLWLRPAGDDPLQVMKEARLSSLPGMDDLLKSNQKSNTPRPKAPKVLPTKADVVADLQEGGLNMNPDLPKKTIISQLDALRRNKKVPAKKRIEFTQALVKMSLVPDD